MYTKAQGRATAKWNKEHCDHITMTIPKGKYKERWKDEAERRGQNLTKFIIEQVERGIRNDKKSGKYK